MVAVVVVVVMVVVVVVLLIETSLKSAGEFASGPVYRVVSVSVS